LAPLRFCVSFFSPSDCSRWTHETESAPRDASGVNLAATHKWDECLPAAALA
jgi:hypothetical protein